MADADERVRELKRGVAEDTVLLDDDSTPAADGSPADVTVRSDEPERIEADVDAEGRGYLVIADSIVRAGWSATVDGKDVTMVPGNHAFAAIPVGVGRAPRGGRVPGSGLRPRHAGHGVLGAPVGGPVALAVVGSPTKGCPVGT